MGTTEKMPVCSRVILLVKFVSRGNTVTQERMQRQTSLSLTSTRERGLIKPRRKSRYVSVTDQVHRTDITRKGDSEDFSAAEDFLIYLGRF